MITDNVLFKIIIHIIAIPGIAFTCYMIFRKDEAGKKSMRKKRRKTK
jgi:hypothetical protein